MPKRMFELESDSTEESWRRIRTLRSCPPGSMPASRSQLFASSLEQAQQQFTAAAHIGYESRALNLYYGLSQSGRAVAAALTPDKAGKSPEVRGHGLKIVSFQSVRAKTLWDVQVRAEGGDDTDTSYGRLASLLRSDPLETPVSLGAIWHMIPEICLDYPVGEHPEPRWTNKPYAAGRETVEEKVFTVQASPEEMQDNETRLRSLYPDLAEARLLKFGGSSYSVLDDGTRTEEALFTFERTSGLRKLRRDDILMPACSAGSKALDPLLAWWVLLYTLSMVTRYLPVVWTQCIDVNRSAMAVPLETALSKALESVPAQLYTTLTSAH